LLITVVIYQHHRLREIFFVTCAALLCGQSRQSTLTCVYSIEAFWQVGNLYACSGTLAVGEDFRNDRKIAQVIGFHKPDLSNSNVLGVKITNAMILFPRGLDNYYPNLEALVNEAGGLIEVSREDFAPFPKLKQLHLYQHKIVSLSSNTFDSNPNLQHISFASSPLKHFGPRFFDNLKQLKSLCLSHANCINEFTLDNRGKVEEIIFRVWVNCPPSYDMLKDEILASYELGTKLDKKLNEYIAPIMTKIVATEEQVTSVSDKMKQCQCF